MSERRVLLKAIVLGDVSVGKTSLIETYFQHPFTGNYKATIGADFKVKDLVLKSRNVSFQIWDTSGMERFASLGNAFYRGSDCCLLVFDVTSSKSLSNLEGWLNEFLSRAGIMDMADCPVVVVGNKVDDPNRKISQAQAKAWCDDHGIVQYFEVSAKDGTNVDKAFKFAADCVMDKNMPDPFTDPNRIEFSAPRPKKKDCCGN
eukprot:TRINITY_DN7895_c0_g1_i1.p2 TRINITY_DN7895_c0_g1~~TRINITY_DN7895_c0_g1_i1.p2  ORF type:complete len:211 (-),score=48.25 TRINITY_DN7895_c0_g1_i1:374-982(-)